MKTRVVMSFKIKKVRLYNEKGCNTDSLLQ